jgi:putative transcriptional regulator
MPKSYKSEALAAIHNNMEILFEEGAIDKVTMREFDDGCLVPATILTPEEIRDLREREMVSQPVFARYLNVSKNLDGR